MLIQVVLGLFGGDADTDAPDGFDLDGGDGAGGIGFRTLVAFLTFFGIAGMAATQSGLGPLASGLCAVGAGSLAFWIAGLVMAQLYRLRSSGTVEIENAVGAEARVYLRVPGGNEGEGKVTVPVQGRTMEYRAVTAGRELKSGEFCRVRGVRGPTTLEVEAISKT